MSPSTAHLCLYVGCRETAQALRLPRHNLWVYPHEDHDRSFSEGTRDPDAPMPMWLKNRVLDPARPEEAGELRHRVAGLDGAQVQQVVHDLGFDVPVVVR